MGVAGDGARQRFWMCLFIRVLVDIAFCSADNICGWLMPGFNACVLGKEAGLLGRVPGGPGPVASLHNVLWYSLW